MNVDIDKLRIELKTKIDQYKQRANDAKGKKEEVK